MAISELTVDELIATANRSNLPIIFVEGTTDAAILRRLEELVGATGAVLSCGGRSVLFSLLERRLEINTTNIVFLADQDMYCIMRNHYRHPDLIYTWGYSIENDLLAGSDVDRLLQNDEKEHLDALRVIAVKWFAREIELAISDGRGPIIRDSLASIINVVEKRIHHYRLDSKEIEKYDSKLFKKILHNYKKMLRGKQLIELYLLILGKATRPARFYKQTLIDTCATQGKNRRLIPLAKAIKARIHVSRR